jgi:hypothetical protein
MPARVVAPDQREGLQIQLDRARGRAIADQDVDLVILQRRVQDLLDDRRLSRWISSMNSTSLRSQVGQHRRQVARLLDHRA